MPNHSTQSHHHRTILLQDTSSTGKKGPWRERKMTSRAVAASMYRIWKAHPRRDAAFKKRADRLWHCGDVLAFGEHVDTETGEVVKRLDAANFCRDRMCPMCQWRKSLVTFHQVSQIMDRIDAERPGLVPLFLTLTMKNVSAAGLADAITRILKAWSRMMVLKAHNRRPHRVAVGWMRVLEITYNPKSREWHPHVHAIVLVEPDYFEDPAKYIDHDAWVSEWRWAMRADYDPSVDVRTIKNDRAHAVAEVSKYAVKPGEWLRAQPEDTDANVRLLATTLKGRRLVAFGGLMMAVRKALKQEDAETADLVRTGDDAEMRGDLRVALERYEWQAGVTNDYVLVDRIREAPESE